MLEEQQGESSQLREQDFPWKKFWAIKRVAPKIKSFLWRAFNNGIAVSQRISRRVEGASTICNICNSEEESVNHLLIHCNFAQAVGFASPFGLHIQAWKDGYYACAAVVRDSKGTCLGASTRTGGSDTVLSAEADGFKLAAELGIMLNLSPIIIEGDSQL